MEDKMNIKEWTSKFNPFNSDKLMSQIPRWRGIKDWKDGEGELPAPTTISIDPANVCDISCDGCNAQFLMQRNRNLLSKETLADVVDFLPTWGIIPYDVKAVCWGGGGESLLNPYTGDSIQRLKQNGIKSGVVTNGTQIHKNVEALCECEWVGVSVDAGDKNTYKNVKGADKFKQVLGNIYKLTEAAKANNSTLALPGRGHGVSYKYLLRPESVGEVYRAAKLAKRIGCRNMHIRPIAPSWDQVDGAGNIFYEEDIKELRRQIDKARELEDENFGIYGITHKFNGDFSFSHDYDKCNAVYMSAVIMPPTDKHIGKFDLGFCCDNRGNDLLTRRNLTSVEQIREYWGSEDHRKLIDRIDVNKCSRCTFDPHNKIYEKAIEVNNMTPDFI